MHYDQNYLISSKNYEEFLPSKLVKIQFKFLIFLSYHHLWSFLAYTVFPHIVSSLNIFPPLNSFLTSWGNYSSFCYIRENLMRKPYEIFKLLWIQKRIVAAATIWGNTVPVLCYENLRVEDLFLENNKWVYLFTRDLRVLTLII